MDFELINKILDPIMNAGALFMIFFVFTIIGLIVRLKPISAIRNGLMIAVGFQGVYIVVDYFLAKIGPVAGALTERFGGVFSYTDIGWAAFASFAWSSPWAYVLVVILILINIVMVLTKMTDTLNLNIWDFWEPIFAALIVLTITENIPLTLIVGAGLGWFNLMLADFGAQKGYLADLGFTGLSFYQGSTQLWMVFGHWLSKVFDKIGWKEVKYTPEKIQEKFGVFGEPVVLGGILALVMAIAAGFFWIDVVMLMISLATALVLLPMMTGIVMQALVPVTEAAVGFLKKSAGGRELYIGVDPALALGNPTTIAVGIIMMPVMLLLAFIIPGNVMVPLADLSIMMFIWIFLIPPMKFDLLRSFVATVIAGIIMTVAGIRIAPYFNMVAVAQGADIPAGTAVSSSIGSGYPEMLVSGLLGDSYASIGFVGVVAIVVVSVVISIVFRLRYLKNKASLANS